MKTLKGIKLKDNYHAVACDLAALHGQTITQFLNDALEFSIMDMAVHDPEHIGKVVCEGWKKTLDETTS